MMGTRRPYHHAFMAVLVTGGAGYIGSVTVERLRARDEDVVVLDDLSRGHRAAIDGVPLYVGDVGDDDLLERVAAEHPIDACVHFAAFIAVGESVQDPASYMANNVERGIRLFNGLLRLGVARVVLSSTAAVYGAPEQVPIPEDHPKRPESPYGRTKLFLEELLDDYDAAYGMRSTRLRYFNAAGATAEHGEDHDPETHLIPNVLAVAAGRRNEVRVFGDDYDTPDGTAIRDYVHVVDLADAHLAALDHLRSGGGSASVNLGSGTGHSVLEVVDAARTVTGHPIPVRTEGRRAGDPPVLVASHERAAELLGWKLAHPELAGIVADAWAWHRRHPDGYGS